MSITMKGDEKLSLVCGRFFMAVKSYMKRRGIQLPQLDVTFDCDLLDQDHKRRKRIYAHAFHGGREHVCLHPDIVTLPLHKLVGIVLHEIGHVMSGVDGELAEPSADEWVRRNLGIEIHYDLKDTLEYLEPKDMKKLKL